MEEQEIKEMLEEQLRLLHERCFDERGGISNQELANLTHEMCELARYLLSSPSLPNVL